MTRTREENAADLAYEEKFEEALRRELEQQPTLVEALSHITELGVCDDNEIYQKWLEETGLDDSFVGGPLGDTFVPGTYQLYEAAVAERERQLTVDEDTVPGV